MVAETCFGSGRRWSTRWIGASAVGVLLWAPLVFAQQPSRTLTGTVSDRREPLKGAVVQVENESTNSVVSYVTDRSGGYSFKRLDLNTDYRVVAVYRGRRSSTKELSHFDTKQEKVIDLVIKDE